MIIISICLFTFSSQDFLQKTSLYSIPKQLCWKTPLNVTKTSEPRCQERGEYGHMEVAMCWGTGRIIYKVQGERPRSCNPWILTCWFDDWHWLSSCVTLQRGRRKEQYLTFGHQQVCRTANQLYCLLYPKEAGGTDLPLFTRKTQMYYITLE